MAKTFLVIDGSSLIHRAFYALPPLSTRSGQYTNAVYGLTTMLLRLLSERKPDAVAVAFDKGKVTFRTEQYAQYKAHRQATPGELSEQFPLAKEVLDAFGVTMLEMEGYEADDIIGTLAKKYAGDYDVFIVTGDKDMLQLIQPQITVLLTRKGISDFEPVDTAGLKERYGLEPRQVIDLKGLMGDASDNIPGVPGVGEKTAKKLIDEFGSMAAMYAGLDRVSGEKLRANLGANRELAELSRQLATIECEAPVVFSVAEAQVRPDMDKVRHVLEKFEFRALADKLPAWLTGQAIPGAAPTPAVAAVAVTTLTEGADWSKLQERIRQTGTVYFVPLVQGRNPEARCSGAVLAVGEDRFQIPAGTVAWDGMSQLLRETGLRKVTHDAKTWYNHCRKEQGGPNLDFDTYVAAYVIDPGMAGYPFAKTVLADNVAEAAELVAALPAIEREQVERLKQGELLPLFTDIEMPLTSVLAELERTGIRVDRDGLDRMDGEISGRVDELLEEIFSLSGERFNVNSTKQLGVVLFEKLGLPVGKKTKTGYSTDADVLEKLAGAHPVVDKLLEYRMLTKLKSTYLDGMRPLIHVDDGRIHTRFNQTVAATGRLSSSEPNLQNIPIRTEIGRKIRTLFIPGEGFDELASADYSQIELRILAHLSGDENLIAAFAEGEDIHTRTAAEIFGVPLAEVTPEIRSRAKAVNFGIVYGISDYGLSQGTGVTRKEAAVYIEGYFARYPKVKAFMDRTIAEARFTGYVTTLFGRRRYLPEINSSNFNLRSFAERMAINTPVQGTAADVIKKAMLDVHAALRREKLKSRLLLQVHDELVLEVTTQEKAAVAALLKDCMEKAVQMSVLLSVDVKFGRTWAETK